MHIYKWTLVCLFVINKLKNWGTVFNKSCINRFLETWSGLIANFFNPSRLL